MKKTENNEAECENCPIYSHCTAKKEHIDSFWADGGRPRQQEVSYDCPLMKVVDMLNQEANNGR